jgi:cob(I)alamin adenosyltransferase
VRIYTRGGDEGKTSLFDGSRVSKSDPRVEVYGTIDELNSLLSWCRVASPNKDVHDVLERVQNELFTGGADFATPMDSKKEARRLGPNHVKALEADSDRFFKPVGNPTGFVLPGETEAGARLHIARTVCRRAERAAVDLHVQTPINPDALRYLNRLSSLLYSLAVWCDKIGGGKTLQNPKYE